MAWSTLEQLKALRAAARKPAIDREDRILHQKYAGQYVAYTDDWNGDELVRTVVAATPDLAEFQRFHATLRAKSGRVKAVAVPPAEPLPEPPPEERGATLDQLKALTAKTPGKGTRWRLNLYRHDRAHNTFLAWNPTARSTAHTPAKFGYLEFEE